MVSAIADRVEELHEKLTNCLDRIKLEVAGRFVYYDAGNNLFILALHATSPEKTQEATQLVWGNIPDSLKAELREANIGFAGKQI